MMITPLELRAFRQSARYVAGDYTTRLAAWRIHVLARGFPESNRGAIVTQGFGR